MDRRARLQAKLGTFCGWLALVMYAEGAATLFLVIHGLAHFFAGRMRTAFRIAGLQMLGLACFGLYYIDKQAYGLDAGRSILLVYRRGTVVSHVAVGRHPDCHGTCAGPGTHSGQAAPAPGRNPVLRAWRRPTPYWRWPRVPPRLTGPVRARSLFRTCGEFVPPLFWVQVLKTRGAAAPQVRRPGPPEFAARGDDPRNSGALERRGAGHAGAHLSHSCRDSQRTEAGVPGGDARASLLGLSPALLPRGARICRLALVPGGVWIAALVMAPMAVSSRIMAGATPVNRRAWP